MSDERQSKDKPLILKQKELVDKLTADINYSGLPAFMVEPLLHNLWLQADSSAQVEYANSMRDYQSMCDDNQDK